MSTLQKIITTILSLSAMAGSLIAGDAWNYSASLDISGKEGNTEEFGTQIGLKASKDVAVYTSMIYGTYDKAETSGVDTADELILGAEYAKFLTERTGLFASFEYEKDDFESIDSRMTPSIGVVYRFLNTADHKFSGKIGLSYRIEEYTNGLENSDFGGRLGVDHYWKFAEWGEMTNELDYTPSFEDADNFLVDHDSGVNIPLGFSDNFALRLGVSNTYNNTTLPGIEELDTTYYLRLVVDWE